MKTPQELLKEWLKMPGAGAELLAEHVHAECMKAMPQWRRIDGSSNDGAIWVIHPTDRHFYMHLSDLPPVPLAGDSEREEFEKWWKTRWNTLVDEDCAWQAWQAARAK